MSSSLLVQATSGWRRMVPVAEQGASSRIASKGSASSFSASRALGLGLQIQAGEVFREPLQPLGRAVDREHLGAGGCELRGLAAGRGAEIGDALAGLRLEQAGREGGGGVLHPPFAVLVTGQLADRACARRGGCCRSAEARRRGARPRLPDPPSPSDRRRPWRGAPRRSAWRAARRIARSSAPRARWAYRARDRPDRGSASRSRATRRRTALMKPPA